MKAFNSILSVGLASVVILLSATGADSQTPSVWPVHDNGLNKVVQWDHYSTMIHGKRLFIWSGEIHYWRIPVPELWIDVMEKAKAAGFNAVGLYSSWGYHEASPEALDFQTGAHNFTRILQHAHDLGLYVIFRPGPYVNAETSGGAFPPWLTTGEYGRLRNNDTRYTKAWKPFFEEISRIVAPFQVTKDGGNVLLYQLENEYGDQWRGDAALKNPNYDAIAYMETLEQSARDSGIDIPLFHNNPNMNTKSWSKDYSNVGGELDMYGIDHYPECWSCNYDECTKWNTGYKPFTLFEYYSHFQAVAPSQPAFMPEFQGGSYNPWGGPQGGCRANSGPDFVNVYYRHNIASRVSAINLYMLFGGTSWGGIASPNVATSYDYSAPISESRDVGDKMFETKLLGLFLRVARDLTKTELVGNNINYATNPAVFTTELRNPDSNRAFYITRHQVSARTEPSTFKLSIKTSLGSLVVPQQAGPITLNGRESKIIITDFTLKDTTVLYSTAELLTASILDEKPVLAFWLPKGESGEIAIKGVKSGVVKSTCADGCEVEILKDTHKLKRGYVIVKYTQGSGTSVVQLDGGVRILLLDRATAYHFWAPTMSNDPFAPEDRIVFVTGPKLVRTANVSGNSITITGDSQSATPIEVLASKDVKKITWNGKPVSTKRTKYGSLIGNLPGPKMAATVEGLKLPALSKWKVKDSLPERMMTYDDSNWTVADHTTTTSFFPPDTRPVLYANEYGYHTGTLLWRARFNGSAEGVFLSLKGGTAFGWSAWLNGKHVGSYAGENEHDPAGNLTIAFPTNLVNDKENVLLVLQDNMGKDLRADALFPRGILNATLVKPSALTKFTVWKVAGSAGGEKNIDPMRGPLSGEGGLHSQRLGWHLPGFDTSSWEDHKSNTLSVPTAGVSYFTITVPLSLPPRDHDYYLAIDLTTTGGTSRPHLRAELWVNGYQFGRFVPAVGNEIEFPVFPGILDYNGPNTIGVMVWNQQDTEAEVTVNWKVLGVVESSFDWESSGLSKTGYLRPSYEYERKQYA